ncbi:thioredoxin-like protein [Microthyrium microscopicum]|uniref:Thioredoxin-like protein n=1 Tax=Microthyrium microscopicum TaxID=703497 RepID=A0A6A6U9U7_9PEZI|nr:thioredoxin-like protein [Microthyrium microscopicum]
MATIDRKVAAVLDARKAANDSDDEDALIAALEDDEDDDGLVSLREKRLQQLHEEVSRSKMMRTLGSGSSIEVKDEKEVLDITTSTKLSVVHFFKPDFGRCAVMDSHLDVLAPKHFDTRFIKINVDNAPFLVTKLNVRVLPCVIAFIDGVGVDRIIGFEGLGNGVKFTTQDLERRLLSAGVLIRTKMDFDPDHAPESSNMGRKKIELDEDDDDWD